MQLRSTLASLGIVAVSLTSLTACGNDTKAADSSSSSNASTSASASSSASSGHLDKAGLIKAVTTGQKKGGSAHLMMTTSGSFALRAQGDVSYRSATPEMRMTMTLAQLSSGPIELRLVDGIVYLHIPKATPAGKFVKIDPQDPSNPMSKSFGSLSTQLDPMSGLKAMQAGVQRVRYAGKDTVDGAATDHYVVTVKTAAMLKALKQKSVAGLPATLTYDMWLDGRDLLRRVRFAVAGQKTDMTLSDWGKPVSVQAPPAADLVKGAGAGLAG